MAAARFLISLAVRADLAPRIDLFWAEKEPTMLLAPDADLSRRHHPRTLDRGVRVTKFW